MKIPEPKPLGDRWPIISRPEHPPLLALILDLSYLWRNRASNRARLIDAGPPRPKR